MKHASSLLVFVCGWLVAIGVMFLSLREILDNFVVDDSFYYLEIARNLAAGNGPTFDGLHYTNGFQPLFQLSLVPVYLWVTDLETAIYVVKFFEALLFGTICLFLYRVTSSAARDRTAGLVAVAFLLLPGPGWHPFGTIFLVTMESGVNGLMCLLALSGLLAYLDAPHDWTRARALRYGVILGLTFLARVDNAVLILGILYLFFRSSGDLGGDRASVRARLLEMSAAAGMIALGYLLWNITYFGRLLPISGDLKLFYDGQATARLLEQGFVPWLEDTFWFFTSLEPINLLPVVGLSSWPAFRLLDRVVRDRLPDVPRISFHEPVLRMLWVTSCVKVLAYAGLLQHGGSNRFAWYYVPEALTLCLVIGIVGQYLLHAAGVRRRIRFATVALVVSAGVSAKGVLQTPEVYGWELSSYDTAQFVRSNLPADAILGSKDAGVLGYFLEQPVINLDGLVNDGEFSDHLKRGARQEYIRAKAIDYLANLVYPDSRDVFRTWMDEESLELVYASEDIVASSDDRMYVVYRVLP